MRLLVIQTCRRRPGHGGELEHEVEDLDFDGDGLVTEQKVS